MKVSILGTEYDIEYKTDAEVAEDMSLEIRECDGYCDSAKELIVIAEKDSFNLGDEAKGKYIKTHLREAIITAFANETSKSLSEETVEWMAGQFPKMLKAFKEVGAIEGCKCKQEPNGRDIMDIVIRDKVTLAEASERLGKKCDEFVDKFLED